MSSMVTLSSPTTGTSSPERRMVMKVNILENALLKAGLAPARILEENLAELKMARNRAIQRTLAGNPLEFDQELIVNAGIALHRPIKAKNNYRMEEKLR